MTIYDFTVMAQDGAFSLEAYRGPSAPHRQYCNGLAWRLQYQGLQELYERYHNKVLKSRAFHAINLWAKRRAMEEINQF